MTEMFWAITGKYGLYLYLGTWFRRIEAIIAHSEALGETWKECYRDGDRAIKVQVIPQQKKKSKKLKLWCYRCKKKQSFKWTSKKGEGIAAGRYRCDICNSMYYG